MSTSIPTSPTPNSAENIMAAVAHGMAGDMKTGVKMLMPFFLQGSAGVVSMCAALSECVAMNARKQNPGEGTFGFTSFNRGAPVDSQEMPPAERFAAQFSTAWLNRQQETAYAIFRAVDDGDDPDKAAEIVADGVMILYRKAVVASLELTAGEWKKRKGKKWTTR